MYIRHNIKKRSVNSFKGNNIKKNKINRCNSQISIIKTVEQQSRESKKRSL